MIFKFWREIVTICALILVAVFLGFVIVSMYTSVSRRASFTVSEGIGIVKYPGNQTAFKFVTPDGVTIITDPYYMDETVEADIVTESHNHADHCDTSLITGDYSLLNTTGSFDIDGVHIVGYSGVHDKGDSTETNIMYVFEVNGIRIAQFASQGALPSDEILTQMGKVDILIIQVMDYNSKMSPEEACEAATALHAKIIIPAHGSPELSDDLADLLGGETETIASGQMTITREDLDQIVIPKVVILDNG